MFCIRTVSSADACLIPASGQAAAAAAEAAAADSVCRQDHEPSGHVCVAGLAAGGRRRGRDGGGGGGGDE